MKVYNYVSFLISLIFLVMGILILSGFIPLGEYFAENQMMKLTFSGFLMIYGIFRGVNAFYKLRNKDED